jgi:hypothetical protein
MFNLIGTSGNALYGILEIWEVLFTISEETLYISFLKMALLVSSIRNAYERGTLQINMGLSSSKPETNVVCETERKMIASDEFELSLDAQAFEFHMLSPVKALRITRLNVDGRWGGTSTSNVATAGNPYEDAYVKITPNGISTNGMLMPNGSSRSIKLTIKKPGVQLLYQTPRMRPRTILCHRGNTPVVYVQMILKRQGLLERDYMLKDNTFLLCGNEYILLLNLPDEGTTIRPSMNQVMERAYIDPSLLFFASQPLAEHHHTQT